MRAYMQVLSDQFIKYLQMKKIIIAVDFSKHSMHALEYGIYLANRMSSDVIMVWVDNQSIQEHLLPFQTTSADIYKAEAKATMDDWVAKYKKKLKKGKLTYRLRRGKVYHEIANLAKRSNADLIIAGTHGVTGYEEYWVGSNAFRIVSFAPCPVITIRYNFVYELGRSKIVLPIDNTNETLQKIPVVAEIATNFESEVHLLTLYTPGLQTVKRKIDNFTLQAEKYFNNAGVKCVNEATSSENLTLTTIQYAEAINAKLIAIMTEQESSSSNILLGPYAQQMVNNSPIPVLCVHAQENFSLFNQIIDKNEFIK